jgi:hypothetical protein
MLSPEWVRYRFTEWVILLILLKLSIYLAHGLDQLWIDLPLWQKNFGQFFLTGEYIVTVFLAFIVWAGSALFSEELAELEGEEGDVRSYDFRGFPMGRAQIRQRLAEHILILGAAMIFLTVLVNIDWNNILPFSRPPQAVISNLLVYFLFSLVLLSLTQYSILKTGWQKEKIPFSREIVLRWSVSTFFLILGVAVFASLLPTGYSMGLLSILNYLISLFILLLEVIWFLLSLPVFLIWALLAKLFQSDMPGLLDLPVPEAPSFSPSAPGTSPPWLELVKSLLFWLIFSGIILYSLRYYLQEHPELVAWLRGLRGARWLVQFWDWLLSRVSGLNRQVSGAIRARIQNRRRERGQAEPGRQGWVSPRRLAPRQQVIFFYGALLRRGRERGLRRQPGQTPFEYSLRLQAEVPGFHEDPEATQNITSLTDQFIEARYSRHEVTPENASLARRYWERIRQTLRKPSSS